MSFSQHALRSADTRKKCSKSQFLCCGEKLCASRVFHPKDTDVSQISEYFYSHSSGISKLLRELSSPVLIWSLDPNWCQALETSEPILDRAFSLPLWYSSSIISIDPSFIYTLADRVRVLIGKECESPRRPWGGWLVLSASYSCMGCLSMSVNYFFFSLSSSQPLSLVQKNLISL